MLEQQYGINHSPRESFQEAAFQDKIIEEGSQDNQQGKFISTVEEVLRFEKQSMDHLEREQDIENYKYVKQYKLNMSREVPMDKPDSNFMPQREIHRYENLTEGQEKQIWQQTFKFKENVICSWIDREGKKLITINYAVSSEKNSEGKELIEFTMNLFFFDPNLNCISQLFRPSHSKVIKQLSILNDKIAEPKIFKNFYSFQWMNIVVSPDEQHLLIRGFGKIRYFRLPRQGCLQDFFSPSFDIDNPVNNVIRDDDQNLELQRRGENPGFKIYSFLTNQEEKTFYLFHNKFNTMQYLCDERDKELIENINMLKNNCELVYPVGEEFMAFVNKQKALMLVHKDLGKIEIEALENINVVNISGDFKSQIKTINVLIAQNEKSCLNLYELVDRELKLHVSFQIQLEQPQLVKQFRNQFFICSDNTRIIRYEINEISPGKLDIQQMEEFPSFILHETVSGVRFKDQIQNASFVVYQYKQFFKFTNFPTFEEKDFKDNHYIKISQGTLHFYEDQDNEYQYNDKTWYSFYKEEPLKQLFSEITKQEEHQIIDSINEMHLIMFKPMEGENENMLYIISPHHQLMLTIENFDSYLGQQYQIQSPGDPNFRLSFLTKNRKLVSLCLPMNDPSGLTVASIDLPNNPANGIVAMSDNGLNFSYITETYEISFKLQQNFKTWEQLEQTRISKENGKGLVEILKSKKVYTKFLNFEMNNLASMRNQKYKTFIDDLDAALLKQTNYIDSFAQEQNRIVQYINWIIKFKTSDNYLYFIDRPSLKTQFIIKFKDNIRDVIVDKEIKEDIYIQLDDFHCYKLNILRDLPGYIPRNLLVVENAVSIYDLTNPNEIQYFENAQKLQQYQCIGILKLRSGLNDIKDRLFQEQFDPDANKAEDEQKQKREVEQKLVEELIQDIEKNQLNNILSYNITFRHHIVKSVKNYADYKTIFDYLEYKFSMSSPEQIPFLNPDISYKQLYQQEAMKEEQKAVLQKVPRNEDERKKMEEERKKVEEEVRFKKIKTPFDIIINLKHNRLINAFLIAMIEKDQTGSLYSDLCDRHVISMAKLGIDLKPYFSSQLVYHVVNEFYYKTDNAFSKSDTPFIAIKDHDSIFDIRLNILQIEKQNVKDQQKKDKPDEEDENDQKYEHRIVSLKETLKNPTGGDFIKMLYKISDSDPTILEIDSIKSIIEFKWTQYGKQLILPLFIQMIAFIGLFIIDQSMNTVSFASYTQYLLRFGQFAILCIFMNYERNQRLKGKKELPVEDLCLFITFSIFMILSFTYDDNLLYLKYSVKCVQCMTVIFIFVKFCILIRIFTELSFLITLIESVFLDLRYFLLFFGIVVGVFTLILNIILREKLEGYFGIPLLDAYVLAMRQSIGDWSTDEITANKTYDELSWLTWFMIAIVGNIVFMNFIIAVVSQSYEKCNGSIVPETERAKLSMIIESERMLTEADFNNANMFPKYIIVRRKTAGGQGSNDGSQQWQGFVKELKIDNQKVSDGVKKDISLMKSKFNQDIEQIQQQSKKDNHQIQVQIEEIKSEITRNFGKYEAQMKSQLKNLEAQLESEMNSKFGNLEADIGQMKSRFDILETKMEQNSEMLVKIIERLTHH